QSGGGPPARTGFPHQFGPLFASDPSGAQQQRLGAGSAGALDGDHQPVAEVEGPAGPAGHPDLTGGVRGGRVREGPGQPPVAVPVQDIPNTGHRSPRLPHRCPEPGRYTVISHKRLMRRTEGVCLSVRIPAQVRLRAVDGTWTNAPPNQSWTHPYLSNSHPLSVQPPSRSRGSSTRTGSSRIASRRASASSSYSAARAAPVRMASATRRVGAGSAK